MGHICQFQAEGNELEQTSLLNLLIVLGECNFIFHPEAHTPKQRHISAMMGALIVEEGGPVLCVMRGRATNNADPPTPLEGFILLGGFYDFAPDFFRKWSSPGKGLDRKIIRRLISRLRLGGFQVFYELLPAQFSSRHFSSLTTWL